MTSGNICYYKSGDPCTTSGTSYSSTDLDSGYEYSSIVGDSASWRFDDDTDTCQTASDPCTTSGSGFTGSAGNCLAAGSTTAGGAGTSDNRCYYDGEQGDSSRSNDCDTGGCDVTSGTLGISCDAVHP